MFSVKIVNNFVRTVKQHHNITVAAYYLIVVWYELSISLTTFCVLTFLIAIT